MDIERSLTEQIEELRALALRRDLAERLREEKRIDLLARLSASRQPNLATVREVLIFLLGGP